MTETAALTGLPRMVSGEIFDRRLLMSATSDARQNEKEGALVTEGTVEDPSGGPEALGREIRQIIGGRFPGEHLKDLLELKPLRTESLNRFFQTKTKIQLKKGQAESILRAINKARVFDRRKQPEPELPSTSQPAAASLPSNFDPDLSALAGQRARELAKVFKDILREVHFDLANREMRPCSYGGDYEIRPFPLPVSPVDTQRMRIVLRDAVKASRTPDDVALARRIQRAFAFFMFGDSLERKAVEELFGEERKAVIDEGLRLGLFVGTEGSAIRMNELSLLSRKLRNGDVIYILADTPPHFETRAPHQRVYVGADSYELMERVSQISQISGHCVEMGSGSGIQIIAALKQFPAITKAIGKERDRRAIHVSLFNAALNGVDDRIAVVDDDAALRAALGEHPVSFAMTNPPFIAMPAWIDIDPEDRPVLSGLMDIRETDHGVQADLRTVFPEAGWGGENGLEVTSRFVDVLLPLLAPSSQVIIYSQFAGDKERPRVVEDYVRAMGDCQFAFEYVASRAPAVTPLDARRRPARAIVPVDETATSVARLIVAALMGKKDPRHLRVKIRKGAPEHALLLRFARKIEESYRKQGITHFHDGFAILTKQEMSVAVEPRCSV